MYFWLELVTLSNKKKAAPEIRSGFFYFFHILLLTPIFDLTESSTWLTCTADYGAAVFITLGMSLAPV